jgi:hypothetical protein
MSSLWTPEGEHPVGPDDQGRGQGRGQGGPQGPAQAAAPPRPQPADAEPLLDEDGREVDLEQLRRQLAETPVEVVVANHAFGLFELAALHLSLQPPQLEEARLAIDAVAALTEGLVGRLGEAEPTLREGLAQLRLAFVQIKTVAEQGGAPEGA